MNMRGWARAGLAVWGVVWISMAGGQRVVQQPAGAQPAGTEIAPSANTATQVLGEVVREVADPGTGDRWLLERDPKQPAGPGRMVRIAGKEDGALSDRRGNAASGTAAGEPAIVFGPVIHAGDRLVVEESTAVVEARLAAVALGPAKKGASLNVRLVIGGKVVRVIALGPGRVALVPQGGSGIRP
jgi:hypothetical protein